MSPVESPRRPSSSAHPATRRTALSVAVVLGLIFAFAGVASAQRQPVAVQPAGVTEPTLAAWVFAEQARGELGHGALLAGAQTLYQNLSRLDATPPGPPRRMLGRAVAEQYRGLRRSLHGLPVASDALLDRFDELSFAMRTAGHLSAPSQPGPRPRPLPVAPPAPLYELRGSIEGTPVYFSGHSREALAQQCNSYVSGARISLVDDIGVFERGHHNRTGFYRAEALCAIFALNARDVRWGGALRPAVEGTIEAVPFRVEGDAEEVRAVLARFLPSATEGARLLDEATINGRSYYNRHGFWTIEQVVGMVASHAPSPAIGPGVYPVAIRY